MQHGFPVQQALPTGCRNEIPTPSVAFDPSILSKNGAWERYLSSWPGATSADLLGQWLEYTWRRASAV